MTYNFKVGDKVIATIDCSGAKPGETYIVELSAAHHLIIGRDTTKNGCTCSHTWKLVTAIEDWESEIKC